jgi:hypothetical protein
VPAGGDVEGADLEITSPGRRHCRIEQRRLPGPRRSEQRHDATGTPCGTVEEALHFVHLPAPADQRHRAGLPISFPLQPGLDVIVSRLRVTRLELSPAEGEAGAHSDTAPVSI